MNNGNASASSAPLMPDRMAVVELLMDGDVMARPALFVFRTRAGYAWVEPGYLDPFGSPRPCNHEWLGTVRTLPNGFECEGERGSALALPVAESEALVAREITSAFR